MGVNIINFLQIICKEKDTRKLVDMRNHYIQQRKNGDHTIGTLTKIKILTSTLLAIQYQ